MGVFNGFATFQRAAAHPKFHAESDPPNWFSLSPFKLPESVAIQVARVGPTSRRATANLDREKLNQVAASNPTEATIGESMI